MTKFMKNVNNYLSEMKIKHTYLSMVTGIEKNKLSRLLNGIQEESGIDMEKIAEALGKKIDFFLSETCAASEISGFSHNKITFYAGEPTEKQEKIVNELMELMENIDEVLSAKSRFVHMTGE